MCVFADSEILDDDSIEYIATTYCLPAWSIGNSFFSCKC
jgi:hypothetical protein